MGRSVVADAPGSLHGFPASLTSFVGRAQATAEIAAQLAEYRLVTLAGAEQACAVGLASCRDVGDLANLSSLLWNQAILDLRAGRAAEAAAHLREQLQVAMRTGMRGALMTGLDCCGHLCAATRRPAEAITAWAAVAALHGPGPQPYESRNPAERAELQRDARAQLGPAGTRAAEERGAAMSLGTAAEYALLLVAAGSPSPPPAAPAGPVAGPAARDRSPGLAQAQPARTRADHPGRPGPYRRADRGPALHHRAHGQLAPGPDQGQDRLPPPCRHHPAGPQRRPRLTRVWVIPPLPRTGRAWLTLWV